MNTPLFEMTGSDLVFFIVLGNMWFFGIVFLVRWGARLSDVGFLSARRSAYMLAGMMTLPAVLIFFS